MKSIEAALASAVASVSPRAGETVRRAADLLRPNGSAAVAPGRPTSGTGRSRRMLLVNGSLLAGVVIIGLVRLIPASQPPASTLFASAGASAQPGASAVDARDQTVAPAAALPSAAPVGSAAALASATPALIPSGSTAVTSPTAGIDPIDLILKTVLVAALVVLGLRLLKRIQNGKPGSGDGITILETRALAPKATLYVVGVRGRHLVVGLTPAGMTTLTEFAEPAAIGGAPVRTATTEANGRTPYVAFTPDVAGLTAPAARRRTTPPGDRPAVAASATNGARTQRGAAAMTSPRRGAKVAVVTGAAPTVSKPEQSAVADIAGVCASTPTFGAALEDALRADARSTGRRSVAGRRGTAVASRQATTVSPISVIGQARAELESADRDSAIAAARRAQSA